MTSAIPPELLSRLDTMVYGSGEAPSGIAADDRSGRYWLVSDPKIRMALKVALVTGRPLLVEGPSGTGKSSLARAVAATLGWAYYEAVITSQTRLDELTGSIDVVRRLYEAELASRRDDRAFPDGLESFVQPGVLWWAFDPLSAVKAARDGRDPGMDTSGPARATAGDGSAVVLVDEIDKAEPDLPNNLLVPLGSLELRVEGLGAPIGVTRPYRPLVVITSNQERDLPPAFLRRCVALSLPCPGHDELVEIAARHVGASAELVEAVRQRFLLPGTAMSPAEFVDAVRAVASLRLQPGGDPELWDQLSAVLKRPPR